MEVIYRDFHPRWRRRPSSWRWLVGNLLLWLVLAPVLSGLFWYAAIRGCLQVIL